MKTVVLILSTRSNTYKEFKEAIRKTWMKNALDANIACYFYEGGWSRNEVVGDTIRLTSDDSLSGTYQKFMDCLRFMDELSIDFEIMYRTNLSSYIDIPVFHKFIKENRLSARSYEGVRGETHLLRERIYLVDRLRLLSRFAMLGERIQFISGAGIFIGYEATKALQYYSGNKNNINLIDDVKIGWILNDFFPSTVKVRRLDVLDSGAHKTDLNDYLNKVNDGLFHYKFKNKCRRFDYENLKGIHDTKYRHSLCVVS